METSAQKRVIYFDMIRIVACFLVIMVHVSSKHLYTFPVRSFDFQTSLFFNMFSITAPGIFFMLSGAIFLRLDSKDISLKKLWGKNILRMAVSYVFWSYLYTFIIWFPHYTFSLETAKAFLLEFFRGVPMYHMWFIPAIISIYVVLPFLIAAFGDKQRCKYYIILFFIIQFLIPTIFRFPIPHFDLLQILYARIPFFLCIGHVGFFVLGYYLSVEDFDRRARNIIYALGIVGMIAAFCIEGYLSISQDTPVYVLDDLFSINSFFVAAAIFVAFRYTPWKVNKSANMIAGLSKLTFGIYLIHPLLMDMIFKYCAFLVELPAVVWILVITAVTFLCSAVIIWMVSKIPIVNKYLI